MISRPSNLLNSRPVIDHAILSDLIQTNGVPQAANEVARFEMIAMQLMTELCNEGTEGIGEPDRCTCRRLITLFRLYGGFRCRPRDEPADDTLRRE